MLVCHNSNFPEVRCLEEEEGVGRQKHRVLALRNSWVVAAEEQTAAPWEAAAHLRAEQAAAGRTDPDLPLHRGSCSPRRHRRNSDIALNRSWSCFCDPGFGLCRRKRRGRHRGCCDCRDRSRPCCLRRRGACGGHTRPGTWGSGCLSCSHGNAFYRL